MKIFIVLHARIPSDTAAALCAVQEAVSFGRYGKVRVVAPRRLDRARVTLKDFYGLDVDVPITYVPTIDVYFIKPFHKLAFYLSYVCFSISVFFYLLRTSDRTDIIITNESLPAFFLSFFRQVVIEIHDYPESHKRLHKKLFDNAKLVIATNSWKKNRLAEEFGITEHKLMVERNAVDLSIFTVKDKLECRKKLGLPANAKVVVYTGHLYGWKGAHVLVEAAKSLPETQVYLVGGRQNEVDEFKKKFQPGTNVTLIPQVPHSEIPYYQSAADCLVLPNTSSEAIASYYTSPMKAFEYMASGRPIVASNLPSIHEILAGLAILVTPDEPKSLAEGILIALNDPKALGLAKNAIEAIQELTWEKRAARIMDKLMGQK